MKNILNLKEFLNEKLVIETKNIAEPGDWIIKAKTVAGEEYVLKKDKFPKLYDIDSAKKPENTKISELGFMEYNIIPEERNAFVCGKENLKDLKRLIGNINGIVPQETMLENIKKFKDRFIKVSKIVL